MSVDYMELARTLDDLNEWKRTGQDDRIAPEQAQLNEYLRPHGLIVALVDSPIDRYPVVYAVISLKVGEQ
jgi:hypothetical protein